MRAQKREYTRIHRAENVARAKAWRDKHPERKAASDRSWRIRNKDRKAALDKAWAQANRKRVNANQRRLARRHPERIKEKSWIQGQKRRGDKPTRETYGYRKVLLCDPCAYCGAPAAETDHIVPRDDWSVSTPGWNDWNNLTGSCLSCNRKKHARSLLTFLLLR